MNEWMCIPSNEPAESYTGFKMLGALAAGAVLGLLVGLPCGRESDVLILCTIVQTLAAIGAPASVLYNSLRRSKEPLWLPDVSCVQGVQQTCM
jgi:hypothetical protein